MGKPGVVRLAEGRDYGLHETQMSLTAAFIIRFHYPENDPRIEWRLKLFHELTLPSLHKQTDRDFDICVRCNPAHNKLFEGMGCKPFQISSLRIPCGLHQYDIQMRLDNDDCVADNYVEYIKGKCKGHSSSLLITFQPQYYILDAEEVVPCGIKYGVHRPSPFTALYYPDKSKYRHIYKMKHDQASVLAENHIYVPWGFCWATIHKDNTSRAYKKEAEKWGIYHEGNQ